MQSWALEQEWTAELARWGYANLHFKGSVLALLVIFFAYRGSYGFVRNTVIAAMAISVLSYWLYPVAPPRFLPELGLDGATSVTGNNPLLSSPDDPLFNPVAAVPSMHVGLSVIFAWSLALLVALAGAEGRAVRLPAADDLRRRGERQPLLDRRALRPDHRRGRGRGRDAAGAGQSGLGLRRPRPIPAAGRRHRGADGGRRERAPVATAAEEISATVRNRLIESRLTPNAISMVGLAGNLAAAVLVWEGYYFLGGVAFILGSIMDTLDGRYARASGKGTLFGAFLDSTLDRVEEGIVLTAVAYRFAETGDEFAAAMCVVVVLGSLMVSYTRARAEALGVECKVGVATRPVRVVILSIGLVFAKGAGVFDIELLAPAIYAMAVLTAFTVVQRVWHVRNALKEMERTLEGPPTGAEGATADV